MGNWEADLNVESGQFTSKGDWGTLFTNSGSPTYHRDCLNHYIKQLKYFLRNGSSPNPRHTKIDLAAYKMVRDTNSEEIAENFFDLKSADRKKNLKEGVPKKFGTNADIVNFMKKEGLWKKAL